MAENSNTLLSYGDVSIREDVVLNAIEILTAQETQIMNMLPKSSAIATVHSYLVDTLRSVSLNGYAVRESDDFTANATTSPTRLTNIVELVAVPFKVSRTQQRIDHYHGQNELTRQTEKALKDWGNGAEFDLVRSLIVSGVSGTIPKMSKRLIMFFKMLRYTVWQNLQYVPSAIRQSLTIKPNFVGFAI